MLSRLEGLPDNVLAVTATGEVTGDDYESVLIPAIDAMLAEHDKIRILYQLGPDFAGFSGAAFWDDARVGMAHIGKWEKIALVTDHEWMGHAARAFGFLMPGEVRAFANSQLAEAQEWVAA